VVVWDTAIRGVASFLGVIGGIIKDSTRSGLYWLGLGHSKGAVLVIQEVGYHEKR